MFGENASFIKTVEIDDSVFQCNPECAEKYLLQLEWSRDNEAWQWRVLKKSDVITSSNSNAPAANDNAELLERIGALESAVQALQQANVEPSPEAPEDPSNDVEPDPEEPGL